jgi:hypothetical protein
MDRVKKASAWVWFKLIDSNKVSLWSVDEKDWYLYDNGCWYLAEGDKLELVGQIPEELGLLLSGDPMCPYGARRSPSVSNAG